MVGKRRESARFNLRNEPASPQSSDVDSSTSESEDEEESKQMDNSRSSMVESADGSRLSVK